MDMSAQPPLTVLHRTGVRSITVLAWLCLALAGCTIVPPQSSTQSSVQPQQAPVPVPHSPPAPQPPPPKADARPIAPPPQPQPVSLARQPTSPPAPPPAVYSKGAEKLLAPIRPLTVRAREQPPASIEPTVTTESTNSPSTTVQASTEALIVKGPPPGSRAQSSKTKLLWCFGLLFAAAAGAIVVRLKLRRAAGAAEGPAVAEGDLKMPRDMGFKEPLDLPQ